MVFKKGELKQKIQDFIGTKMGTLPGFDEALFLNANYNLYDRISHIAKLTNTEKCQVIIDMKKRVRMHGFNKALRSMNDRTQGSAFLSKMRRIKKKGVGVTYSDDGLDEME